ncbi:pleckstrin homology domain-containing family J member 1 isoform X2 [Apteryx rowi]|uniref:pleckstrin homology domain-containing family J member 1 isoform X2 n=1 Tax=Apteryx rowi TaxID=308060 RepID=UPI000E1DE8FB|nr:pleckstrin homology domain-containing family J member 1 isoform X2 [Apteryx rowi]
MLFFFAVLKKRLVKLVVNFLFYFRTDEAEPIGALLLEHCRITKEEENVFSISFIEEPERKYCFECDSEQQCQEWIEALKRASYEFMRRSLIFYRNEIQKMTGKLCPLQGLLDLLHQEPAARPNRGRAVLNPARNWNQHQPLEGYTVR